MKNTIIVILLLLGAGVVAVFALRVIGGEDAWICQDGVWVAHGKPSAPKPTKLCGGPTEPGVVIPAPPTEVPSLPIDGTENRIRVTAPQPESESGSPLQISGEARGNWFFEASFPVRLQTGDGKTIVQGVATAQGEWMTEEFVSFTASLPFTVESATNAVLVLERDNPSGLPEQDASISLPVVLLPEQASGTMPVNLYFSSTKIDPETTDCNKSYPVERMVGKTAAVARAALTALLEGPNPTETEGGYQTSINPGVKIESLTIDNGVARVDFDARMGEGVGGSCRVAMIRSQIENTLKQFSTVSEVVISVEGNVEEALQP